MVELDEEAAGIIKNLLDPDLQKRKDGLRQLDHATFGTWDIKYREYLWKAIEEEKSKSFQKTLVKFAVQKMEENSLRKMIRIIENNDLHAGSTSYIAGRYMELETPKVREALIKSLQRDPRFIPQFVLRLLNEFEFYKRYEDEKYSSLIRDVLTEPVPMESRKEFFIRIMNWYFRGMTHMMLQANIWEIIKQDKELHNLLFDAFYSKPVKHNAKFVKPAYFPRLLPFRKMHSFRYTRDRPVFSWIKKPMELEFLYDTAYTEDKQLREKYIKIIANLEIPQFSYDATRDGLLSNMYSDWNKITINDADLNVTDVEEFERTNLLRLFPELEENPALKPGDILQGLNPHSLFYYVLRYLPRYLLASQIQENDIKTARIEALKVLKNGKYWTEKQGSNLLEVELMGPSAIWKQVLTDCVNILGAEIPVNIQSNAAQLLYYLIDFVDTPPDLEKFWKNVSERFKKLEDPVREFEITPKLEILDTIKHDFVEELAHVIQLDSEDELVYQKELEVIVELAEKYIQDLQKVVDNLLEGKEVLLVVERELIKYYNSILPLKRINYWFDILLEHVDNKIKPIKSFSNNHKDQFDLYLKRIGELSEYFRELQQVIGDPKEFTLEDKHVLTDLDNYSRKIEAKNNSLGLSPYRYLEPTSRDSVLNEIEKSMIELRDEFQIIDPTNLKSTVEQHLDQLFDTNQKLLHLYFRLTSPENYEIKMEKLENYTIKDRFTVASYLLRQEANDDIIKYFEFLFSKLSSDDQLELLEMYSSLVKSGLVEPHGNNQEQKTIPQIFKSSSSVKVRTRAAFLMK